MQPSIALDATADSTYLFAGTIVELVVEYFVTVVPITELNLEEVKIKECVVIVLRVKAIV